MRKIWKILSNLILTMLIFAWVGLLVIIATLVEPMWDNKKPK